MSQPVPEMECFMAEKVLEVNQIKANIEEKEILHGVDLSVGAGEVHVLMGPNGAGKSTTMKTIMGVMKPGEGDILFEGKSIRGKKPYQIVSEGVVLVPEGRQILQTMTVAENLEMGAYQRKDKAGIAEDMEKVFAQFPRLKERAGQYGGTLSGGEQQMLAIGRAMMARPKVMLLDEPSMGLAPLVVQQIFDVVREINQNGTTVLLVEQNARKALAIADYAYVMETGRIVLEGPAQEVAANPSVMAAYLGGRK